MQDALEHNPRVNLLSIFPPDYKDRSMGKIPTSSLAPGPGVPYKKELPKSKRPGQRPGPANFRANLVENASSATVVFHLSAAATSFLAGYLEHDDPIQDPLQRLTPILKRMFSESEKLWEFPTRGMVLKCNEDLAAKVIRGDSDFTEYTSLQYLAKHAPHIPAPKPHGLITLKNVTIIFMTYLPSTTLERVWSSLSHDNKVIIQHQLDDMFTDLRRLKYDGQVLGGVNGEGVKNEFMFTQGIRGTVNTVAQFEDLQFSESCGATTSWITFLRSFLPPPTEGLVFTHGDIKMANIMVKKIDDGFYTLSGVIDWETSGFYPESFEASKLWVLTMHSEEDWFAYLPPCISPARHPVQWLVNRLWFYTVCHS